jgi:putative hydrolases of HD superfamily
MEQATNILEFMKFSEKLKTVKRSVQKSNKEYDSVADHSWQLAMFALLVYPHLKDKVDLLKTLKMIIIHDLVEAEIGDLPYYVGFSNPTLADEKELKELEELSKIKKTLTGIDENLASEVDSLWKEYKERKTKESIFVKALDSIEANFQSVILDDITYWGDLKHDVFLNKADKFCSDEKILSDLNKLVKEKMKDEIKKIKK